MKYIDKLGVEVETCIVETNFYVKNLRNIKGDGSINLDREFIPSDMCVDAREVVSEPLPSLSEAIKFLDDLKPYVYDEGINSSMGFHLHISLRKPVYYMCLFSKDFSEYMLSEMKKKMPRRYLTVLGRVDRNSYCKRKYGESYFMQVYNERESSSPRHESPCGASYPCDECDDCEDCGDYDEDYYDEPGNDFDYARYRMVNFIDAWHKFGTFEIRMFDSRPMDDLKEYVKFATVCINKYLDENLKGMCFEEDVPLVRGSEETKDSEWLLLDEPEFVKI